MTAQKTYSSPCPDRKYPFQNRARRLEGGRASGRRGDGGFALSGTAGHLYRPPRPGLCGSSEGGGSREPLDVSAAETRASAQCAEGRAAPARVSRLLGACRAPRPSAISTLPGTSRREGGAAPGARLFPLYYERKPAFSRPVAARFPLPLHK